MFYYINLSHWKFSFQWLQSWENKIKYFIFYRVDFFEYYRNHYLKYEKSNDQIQTSIIVDESDVFLINFKIKALRKKQLNGATKLFNEIEHYLQNSITDSREQKFVLMWKSQFNQKYSVLARIIKNILSISVNDVEVKRLFNQNRDIFHYRRKRIQTKIIKTLMILHIHKDRNSSDTDAIANINNDSKSNDRNSKDESEKDFRDIDVFVEANLNNESNVFLITILIIW